MDILIIEDSEDVADLIAFNLERKGWRTTIVHSGEEGVRLIRESRPDMVILDIMLPGMDGLEVYRTMKQNEAMPNIPTLFLSARVGLEDRLQGLQLGADDYMTKPFSPKELVLRVGNILQRVNSGMSRLMVRQGALVLDKNTLHASLKGERLDLTTAEFKLLAYLMERPCKVQDRYELQKILFGYADTTQSRALDTHIKRLRQKLGDYAGCIVTERGVGYAFSPGPALGSGENSFGETE